LRVVQGKSIAFVQYKWRVAAEFAKEAMSDQSLDSQEILNVRWASEDSTPEINEEKEEELQSKAWEKMKETNPEWFNYYESLYKDGQYPDTNHQYQEYNESVQYDPQYQQYSEGVQYEGVQYDPNNQQYYQQYNQFGELETQYNTGDQNTEDWQKFDQSYYEALELQQNAPLYDKSQTQNKKEPKRKKRRTHLDDERENEESDQDD